DIQTVMSACYTVVYDVVFQKRFVQPDGNGLLAIGASQATGIGWNEVDLTLAGTTLHEYNFSHETSNFDPVRDAFSRSTDTISGRCGETGTRPSSEA